MIEKSDAIPSSTPENPDSTKSLAEAPSMANPETLNTIKSNQSETTSGQYGVPEQEPKNAKCVDDPSSNINSDPTRLKLVNVSELTEEEIGIPVHFPENAKSLSDQDLKLKVKLNDEVDDKIIDEMHSENSGFRRFRSSSILSLIFVFCISATFIILINEVAQFVATVQQSPKAIRVIAYLGIGLLGCCFIWSMIRLALTYSKMIDSPRVRRELFREFQSRAVTRKQIQKELNAGMDALRSIVESYPISDPKHIRELKRFGAKQDQVKNLENYIKKSRSCQKSTLAWFNDCECYFVNTIDEIAQARVDIYAKRVLLKTMLCRNSMLDAFIISINAVLMVEDLCTIYNLRTNRLNSVRIAGKIAYQTLISAELEDRIEDVVDSDAVHSGIEYLSNSLPDLFGTAAGNLLPAGLKKGAEGAINYLLFRRLGMATINALRPIRKS